MSGEDSAPASFSRASAHQRIAALLDEGATATLASHGRVVVARGMLEGRTVNVAASDTSTAHGAIGTEEADALIQMLAQAQVRREPVLLLLDSAGANVEQGLAALGAFRRLFRAMLAARAAGVPMLALLGRSCFGGASMLACACHARSYLPQTRLATSGPAVIEGAVGKDELDASDQRAVSDLMGSASRIALHPEDSLRDDTLIAARAAAAHWMQQPMQVVDRVEEHMRLGRRLGAAGADLTRDADVDSAANQRAVSALLPPGYQAALQRSLFCALPAEGSPRALFLGTLGGTPVGAGDCWVLADWLLAVCNTHPGSPVVLVLDAQGHAARVLDERMLLSDYLVHLSLVIAHLSQRGHRVSLWIPGDASGASYVAFAAPAERVSALPSARIAVLPSRAVHRILGEHAQPAADDWFATGVADALLDSHLSGYRADPGEAS